MLLEPELEIEQGRGKGTCLSSAYPLQSRLHEHTAYRYTSENPH